jgi:hypothetical protein
MGTSKLRVELHRSGGFAGRELHISLDTEDLPATEAQRLDDAVATLDLDALASASPHAGGPTSPHAAAGRAGPARDLMTYRLTVERDGRRWQFVLQEPDVPPSIRPLLQELVRAAS